MQARDVPPRTAFALEQAGVHPLLARLLGGEALHEARRRGGGRRQASGTTLRAA